MSRFSEGFRPWVRWIFAVFAAVVISVAISDFRVVEAEQEGCERRQVIFRGIEGFMADSYEQLREEGDPDARTFDRRARIVRRGIVADCSDAYPHILPFIAVE